MMNLYSIRIEGQKSDRIIKAEGAGCAANIEDLLDYALNDFKEKNGDDVEITNIRIKELLK